MPRPAAAAPTERLPAPHTCMTRGPRRHRILARPSSPHVPSRPSCAIATRRGACVRGGSMRACALDGAAVERVACAVLGSHAAQRNSRGCSCLRVAGAQVPRNQRRGAAHRRRPWPCAWAWERRPARTRHRPRGGGAGPRPAVRRVLPSRSLPLIGARVFAGRRRRLRSGAKRSAAGWPAATSLHEVCKPHLAAVGRHWWLRRGSASMRSHLSHCGVGVKVTWARRACVVARLTRAPTLRALACASFRILTRSSLRAYAHMGGLSP